jgi:hypothetical protein
MARESFRIRSDFDPFHYHRGAFIGKVADHILENAKVLGIPVNGRGRALRLHLASELLDREVHTYKEVSDIELWSIADWTQRHNDELQEWLRERYGYQERML